MDREGIKYYVVDAFAEVPFKGNPEVVIVLDDEKEEVWMQAVAGEFNVSATCFLTNITDADGHGNPRFRLRWFAPHAELKICGAGTVASAYVLFSTGMVNEKKIEFISPTAGVLTASRIDKVVDHRTINGDTRYVNGNQTKHPQQQQQQFLVQLGFPLIPTVELDPSELGMVPKSLAGPSTLNMAKMSFGGDLLLELSSSKQVADLQPSLDEIKSWPGRGVIVTGAAPPDSGFDFYSRFFLPNFGIPEDPVCGSAHCSLAPYWSEKLGKSNLKAYMASSRGGVLEFQVDKDKGTVLIAGNAALVMEGLLYA